MREINRPLLFCFDLVLDPKEGEDEGKPSSYMATLIFFFFPLLPPKQGMVKSNAGNSHAPV